MGWTWTGGTLLSIKLSHKGLVEIVMVTVIMTVDLVMTVAVTMVVVVVVDVHHVAAAAAGTASSVENLVILLGSAHLGMVGEGIDMVAEMTGMAAAAVVMDLTVVVVVTDTLAVAEMVAATGATATTVTGLVPTDGLDLEQYVPSRYEIYLLL